MFEKDESFKDKYMVQRYSQYINRILLSTTYKTNRCAYLRHKYKVYIDSLLKEEEKKLSFFERQEIDNIIKDGKAEQAKQYEEIE